MPLGIFGSSSNNGPKPQPLTSEKKEKREKGSSLVDIKDSKGTTIKLGKKNYTVEKKLAEGGFALVYLVCDKHNRSYALKRQLIRDDPRQVEACRTECQIVKNLNGHKNIVTYLDHQLSVNKIGIYDYMLLTVYYPTNVLQLMNSRLLSNRWLTTQEILNIFCDVCEAVARLHHSKTPVIHRDLKIENVLIDQRTGSEKPVYILCDFGSATTKVLSKETHDQQYIEEEIRRYTTLSYRAPEMIDLFSGVPISTKSDIWALGVLLYKICYFSLPFGESALAIQNGTFSFPDTPVIPDEIKAIINLLLTSSARHRPNIFQTAYLTFAAANQKCPVYNIEKSLRIELTEAVQILCLRDKLGSNYARLFEKAFNDFENAKNCQSNLNTADCSLHQPNNNQNTTERFCSNQSDDVNLKDIPILSPAEGVIVNTAISGPRSSTTSVNPRLRPKASTSSNILLSTFGVAPSLSIGQSLCALALPTTTTALLQSTTVSIALNESSTVLFTPANSTDIPKTKQQTEFMKTSQISTETVKPLKAEDRSQKSHLAYTVASQTSTTVVSSIDNVNRALPCANFPISDVRPISSCLKSSAFQPYSISVNSQQQRLAKPSSSAENENPTKSTVNSNCAFVVESYNPFIMNPCDNIPKLEHSPLTMDDNVFGERFDELRRVNRQNTIEATPALICSSSSSNIFSPISSSIQEQIKQSFTNVGSCSYGQSSLKPQLQRTVAEGFPNLHNVQQQTGLVHQQIFLSAQKQRFVKTGGVGPISKVPDLSTLEQAFEKDPFGKAPAILPHQLVYNNKYTPNNFSKYCHRSNSSTATILTNANSNNSAIGSGQ